MKTCMLENIQLCCYIVCLNTENICSLEHHLDDQQKVFATIEAREQKSGTHCSFGYIGRFWHINKVHYYRYHYCHYSTRLHVTLIILFQTGQAFASIHIKSNYYIYQLNGNYMINIYQLNDMQLLFLFYFPDYVHPVFLGQFVWKLTSHSLE